MRTFCDTSGREWELNVNVGSIARVRESAGFLLPSIMDKQPESIGEFLLDDIKVGNTLWGLCRVQAAGLGVSQDDFLGSLEGDSLGAAQEALVRATADFFTSPEQRAAMHKLIDLIFGAGRKFMTMATTKALVEIEKIDQEELAQSCLDFVTSGQGKPALTQTPEPLVNST